MLYRDYEGRETRLSEERLQHILTQHPFLVGKEWAIRETLEDPDEVRESNQDERVNLYYRWYNLSEIDGKFICIVVRAREGDNLVVTTYPTERVKRGDLVWRRN